MPVFSSLPYESHPVDGVKVYLWRTTEKLDSLCALLRDRSLLQKEPYSAFKSEKRKIEWVAVRVLLQSIGQQPLSIGYQTNGKPFLIPHIAEFSISHTKNVVSIALSARPVGMDVETVSSRALKLAPHFLNSADFEPLSVSYSELMATYLWSAKESVYKLISQDGLELKADITLQSVQVSEDYCEFCATVTGCPFSIHVYGYQHDTFVLTLAVGMSTEQ